MKKLIALLLCILCLSFCACGTQPQKVSPIEDFQYEFVDGCAIITGYTGTDFDIVIPSSIEGRSVTVIAEEAFKKYDLKSVVIPYGVVEIGEKAFYGCACLEHISLPDTIQKLDDSTFKETLWYEKQSDDSILYIDNICIGKKGSAGKNIIIKDGTKSIVDKAFYDYAHSSASTYSSIYIPESVEYIGSMLGYYRDPYYKSSNIVLFPWKLIDGFIITGKPGSAAETYAKENDITFLAK